MLYLQDLKITCISNGVDRNTLRNIIPVKLNIVHFTELLDRN